MQTWRVIGLMSGTSMDGIDAALVETDGITYVRPLAHHYVAYDESLRQRLREAMARARTSSVPEPLHPPFAQLADDLTRLHAHAVDALQLHTKSRIDLIGFHGQTIAHRPDQGWTWQLGNGALLAALCNTPVVNDFRSADVVAGGQGAPLVPIYHAALCHALPKPVAILNIGGVANVTWIGAEDHLLAFDTGPGNALIDDWMRQHTGQPYDRDGAAAAQGKVDTAFVAAVLAGDWFKRPPPKSLDRDHFANIALPAMNVADGAATLTALTAASVARATQYFLQPARNWWVAGGGRHNSVLMALLSKNLKSVVQSVDTLGWHGDGLEAEAFAYLAVRSLRGLPYSLPGTTGVAKAMTGGVVHRPIA